MTGYVPNFEEPVDVIANDLIIAADHNLYTHDNLRDLNNRLANLGGWTAVPFSAANFFSDDQDPSHVWTVDAGPPTDLISNRFVIVEDSLMIWNLHVSGTTTSGGLRSMNITIPAGRKSANGSLHVPALWSAGASGSGVGGVVTPTVAMQDVALWVACWRFDAAQFPAYPNVTNGMALSFSLLMEIQPT